MIKRFHIFAFSQIFHNFHIAKAKNMFSDQMSRCHPFFFVIQILSQGCNKTIAADQNYRKDVSTELVCGASPQCSFFFYFQKSIK